MIHDLVHSVITQTLYETLNVSSPERRCRLDYTTAPPAVYIKCVRIRAQARHNKQKQKSNTYYLINFNTRLYYCHLAVLKYTAISNEIETPWTPQRKKLNMMIWKNKVYLFKH